MIRFTKKHRLTQHSLTQLHHREGNRKRLGPRCLISLHAFRRFGSSSFFLTNDRLLVLCLTASRCPRLAPAGPPSACAAAPPTAAVPSAAHGPPRRRAICRRRAPAPPYRPLPSLPSGECSST